MPSRTNLSSFYYVCVLRSRQDNKNYIGYTADLRRRMDEHNKGEVISTRPRRPLDLIYYEACLSEKDARRREKYFKVIGGRRFLAKRLKDYLYS